MNYPANLTVDERIELSAINFIAHNLAREKAGTTKIPCWLCMSAEAKTEARRRTVDWYNNMTKPLIPFNMGTLQRHMASVVNKELLPSMQQWINAEAESKRLREEEKNPAAFFAANAHNQ